MCRALIHGLTPGEAGRGGAGRDSKGVGDGDDDGDGTPRPAGHAPPLASFPLRLEARPKTVLS